MKSLLMIQAALSFIVITFILSKLRGIYRWFDRLENRVIRTEVGLQSVREGQTSEIEKRRNLGAQIADAQGNIYQLSKKIEEYQLGTRERKKTSLLAGRRSYGKGPGQCIRLNKKSK